MADRLVEVEALSYWHGAQQTLDDISMHINAGEVLVLTGPSGSGKSTLLTIIGGLRSASHGQVEVLGKQLAGAGERLRVGVRRRIGFIFQQHNLAPALTVAQNIQLGLQHSRAHRKRDAAARISEIADRVGLGEHLHKHPGQLSGGQQQRAGIARALVNQPSLVLADEPTASLDRASGQTVLSLFDELAAHGSAVVLVTHDKRILEQADRIVMLEDGRLVPATDQLLKDTSQSVRTLMQLDSKRLGRMLSFGQALAQVALADGHIDASERAAVARAIEAREVFSGAEVELVVDLAIAQAQAAATSIDSDDERAALRDALYQVAEANDGISVEERAAIDQLVDRI